MSRLHRVDPLVRCSHRLRAVLHPDRLLLEIERRHRDLGDLLLDLVHVDLVLVPGHDGEMAAGEVTRHVTNVHRARALPGARGRLALQDT